MKTTLTLWLAMSLAATALPTTASVDPTGALCDGNLYTINAGRGDIGLLIDLHESKAVPNSQYFGQAVNLAEVHSRALFSASAMSYNEGNNRIYYASTPTPSEFHIANVDSLDLSAEELAGLKLHPKAYKPHQFGYFDVATQEHHLVGNTRFPIWRMAFDPTTGILYGADVSRFFRIDPQTGEQTVLGVFSINMRAAGFANWGDFIFKDNELLFVTNNRVYSLNKETGEETVKFYHTISHVTAATLDQNGEILIAAKNENVTGAQNSTNLWRLNPDSSTNLLPSQRYLGLFPMSIDAIAKVSTEQDSCYWPFFGDTK